jgi:hypothetical protein
VLHPGRIILHPYWQGGEGVLTNAFMGYGDPSVWADDSKREDE